MNTQFRPGRGGNGAATHSRSPGTRLVGKVPYFGNHGALTSDAKYPVTVTVDVVIGGSEDGVTAVSTRWLTSSEDLPFVFDMPATALRITRTEDLGLTGV